MPQFMSICSGDCMAFCTRMTHTNRETVQPFSLSVMWKSHGILSRFWFGRKGARISVQPSQVHRLPKWSLLPVQLFYFFRIFFVETLVFFRTRCEIQCQKCIRGMGFAFFLEKNQIFGTCAVNLVGLASPIHKLFVGWQMVLAKSALLETLALFEKTWKKCKFFFVISRTFPPKSFTTCNTTPRLQYSVIWLFHGRLSLTCLFFFVQSAVGEKSVQVGWTKGLGFCCMILKNQLIWFSRKKWINNNICCWAHQRTTSCW